MVPKKVLPTDYTTAEVTATDLVPMMDGQMVTLMDYLLVLRMDKPMARVTAMHLVSVTAGQMELLLLSMYDCLLKAQDQNSNYY